MRIVRPLATWTIALALVLSACTGGSSETTAAGGVESTTTQSDEETTTTASGVDPADELRGGEATWGLLGEMTVLDPFPSTTETFAIRSVLFEALITFDDGRTPQGLLADSVEISDDNTEMVLSIREGVTFHDGTPLDADAVLWNLDLVVNEEVAALGGDVLATATISAPDDMTVSIVFPTPTPQASDIIQALPIVSPEGGIDGGSGTGPFVVDDFAAGDSLRVIRNEDYWGELALLDAVTIRTYPDAAGLVAAVEGGAVDYMWNPPLVDTARLQGNPDVTVETRPADGAQHMLLNTTRGCLADSRVRQAFSLAFDRDRYIETQLQGLATAQTQVFVPLSPVFSEEINSRIQFDLDTARALIEDADCDVSVEIQGPPDRADFLGFMPVFVEDLASIGVEATIAELDRPTWLDNFFAGNYDITLHSYSGADLDPAFLFQRIYLQPVDNVTGFESQQYTDLLASAQAESDADVRRSLYEDVARVIQDESFVIQVANQLQIFVSSSRLKGVTLVSGAPLRADFSSAYIDE
jgi:peptide/nickel transport system substrate-binding protein